jgi:hypothetical protein
MIVAEDSFNDDLQYLAVHSVCPNISSLMRALMVQIDESVDAQRCLVEWRGENKNPFFTVSAIDCFQNQGLNVYRLRPLGNILRRYRVIYAYDNEYDNFHLLAVVEKPPENENGVVAHNRVYNYEPDHFITHRIIHEYDDVFCFPRIGGG